MLKPWCSRLSAHVESDNTSFFKVQTSTKFLINIFSVQMLGSTFLSLLHSSYLMVRGTQLTLLVKCHSEITDRTKQTQFPLLILTYITFPSYSIHVVFTVLFHRWSFHEFVEIWRKKKRKWSRGKNKLSYVKCDKPTAMRMEVSLLFELQWKLCC